MKNKDLNVLLIVKRADGDKQEVIFGGVFESSIKALEATKKITFEHDYWKIEPVKINELRQIRIMWRDCADEPAEDKIPQKESRFAPYIRNLLKKVD